MFKNINLKFISLLLLLGICLSDIHVNIPKYVPHSFINNQNNLDLLLGVMVEFQEEFNDEPTTSGNGKFLDSLNIGFINYNNISRCNNQEHMLLDPPPHNKDYFYSQMKSVQNYYNTLYQEQKFDIHIIDNMFQVSKEMREYAYSNEDITSLFVESVDLANLEISQYLNDNNYNQDNVLIVVFHAGLGQDIQAGIFDPTVYDIHSAYIDSEMLLDINYNGWLENGILLPETLNMLYYDVVEDIFSPILNNIDDLENAYCDIQYGITGLFAYLLGYRLGFPPMHSTDNLNEVQSYAYSKPTRIGQFGLMDVGMFNGRGIMPALPNPWARVLNDISNTIDITVDVLNVTNKLDTTITKRSENDFIFKISLTDDEYFLIENSNNRFIYNNEYNSIDEIIVDSLYALNEMNNDTTSIYWLDIVRDNNLININDSTGVIESVVDYDHGMPGSGILIWHIIEPNHQELFNGINNDFNNKSVHLEEGDGIINIGLSAPGFTSSLTDGWTDDYWYKGNQTYIDVNSQNQSFWSDITNTNNNIFFDYLSSPNSNLESDVESYFSIEITSAIQNTMSFTIRAQNSIAEISTIDSDLVRILGNDGQCLFFVTSNNPITIDSVKTYGHGINCNTEFLSIQNFLDTCSKDLNIPIDSNDIILYNENLSGLCLVEDDTYYITDDNNIANNSINGVWGYYSNLELQEILPNYTNSSFSLGDINQDGFDELIEISDSTLYVVSNNNIQSNGFPIQDKFFGEPLVANIFNFDNNPEIICKNGDKISFISNTGEIKAEFPLYNKDSEIFIIYDENFDKLYLINKSKAIIFEKENFIQYTRDDLYWTNPKSTTYNFPQVQGPSLSDREQLVNSIDFSSDFGIDISRAYNYPNPFSNYTTFRYYVGNATKVTIKIYDVAGFLIDELTDEGLQTNKFNEIAFNASNHNPGLYFAVLKSDMNETKLIKLLVTD